MPRISPCWVSWRAFYAGNSEVGDADAFVGGQNDVGRPDVPVNDPSRMSEVEGVRGLLHHPDRLRGVEAARAGQGDVEGRTLDMFQRQIRQTVYLAHVVEGHDVGVGQSARDPRLVVEALEEPVPLRARWKIHPEGLDGEDSPDERIGRPIDGPRAPRAQFPKNLVTPDLGGNPARSQGSGRVVSERNQTCCLRALRAPGSKGAVSEDRCSVLTPGNYKTKPDPGPQLKTAMRGA